MCSALAYKAVEIASRFILIYHFLLLIGESLFPYSRTRLFLSPGFEKEGGGGSVPLLRYPISVPTRAQSQPRGNIPKCGKEKEDFLF